MHKIIQLFARKILSVILFLMLAISVTGIGGASNVLAQGAGGESQLIVPPTSSAIELRWFIGLGTGTDPAQIAIEQSVADDFNASHPNIQVVLEVVPYVSARDTLAAEIAAGAGPDVVGPVGWIASNAFHGEWLDLAPYITSSGFDTSVFTPALVDMYNTDEGQVSLPFAVYPSAIYYNATSSPKPA